ncbi:MAG: type IV secretory system conjugative DNA transfer family protein [Pseudomonadales bacterium]
MPAVQFLQQRREERNDRLTGLIRVYLWGPVLVGCIAILPVSAVAALALCGSIFAFLAQCALDRNAEIKIFDSLYDGFEVDDADILRATYLGQAMPFFEWRNGLDVLLKEHGMLTVDQRRDYAAKQYSRMTPFMFPDDMMTRHLAVIGPTGAFKTELVTIMADQQIRRGGGMILLEAKSDNKLAGAIYNLCKRHNVLHKLDIINLEHPALSHSYNPFFSGNVRSTLSTAMKMQAEGGEEFWQDTARYSLTAAILAFKAQPGSPAFNLKDMVALLGNFDLLIKLIRKINIEESEDHKNAQEFCLTYLNTWWNDSKGEFDTNRYKTLLQGMISKLSAFTHSEYNRIINAYAPQVDLKRSILDGRITVLSMSSLMDKDGTSLMGRLFMSDIARAIGEIQAEGLVPLIPCPISIDEYPSIAHGADIGIFQLSRSANCPMQIFFQGKSFLNEVGREFATSVLSQCWHHIYGDVRDPETRKFASEISPTIIRQIEQTSTGSSFGMSHGSETSGVIAQETDGQSVSRGTKELRETLLQPDDFEHLEQGDAILVGTTGTYRIRLGLIHDIGTRPAWKNFELLYPEPRRGFGINLWEQAIAKYRGTFDI